MKSTILYEKPKAVGETKTKLTTKALRTERIKKLVDSIGAHDEAIASIVPEYLVRQRGRMYSELVELVNKTVSPKSKGDIAGKAFVAKVGVLADKRSIDVPMKDVAKMLGDAFWEVCKVNLSDLDDLLNEEQKKKLLKIEKGTNRKISIQRLKDVEKK